MDRRRTIGQYRTIDLMMFAVMCVGGEWLLAKAATAWFPAQPYTVSLTAVITAIVQMRWGPWAALHALLGGAAFCAASGAEGAQYAVYCAGNLLSLAALPLLTGGRHESIRGDALKTMGFGLAVLWLMELGRGLCSLLFGGNGADMLRFFTTDVISMLFTAVLMWIARRQDGMLEDQKHYLLRVSREQEEEKENSYEG